MSLKFEPSSETHQMWTKIGAGRGVQLPVVAYGEMEAFYGPVPMDSGAI